MNLKFLGFDEVFDICQIMLIKMNSEESIARVFSLPGSEEKDIKNTKKFAANFFDPNKRMKLFFDLEYRSLSFMSDYYGKKKDAYEIKSLKDFEIIIREDKEFINKVVEHYLGKTYDTERELRHALTYEFEKLDSYYKEGLTNLIYFENEYVAELLDAMWEIQKKLIELYKEEEKALIKLCSSFDIVSLVKGKKGLKKWYDKVRNINVAFSLCNHYVVGCGYTNTSNGWLVIGIEFMERVGNRENAEILIHKFSNALGEEIRVKIVEEVQKAGEITATELTKIFNLPMSAIFYHLDVLKKATILCYRIQKRVAYYWVNQLAFENAIDELKKIGGI